MKLSDITSIKIKPFRPSLLWRAKWFVRRMFWKIRIDVCFGENDGFDIGCFCFQWKRAIGPFMLHRQYANESAYAADDCDECGGPWRLMIALSSQAYAGFDEALCK